MSCNYESEIAIRCLAHQSSWFNVQTVQLHSKTKQLQNPELSHSDMVGLLVFNWGNASFPPAVFEPPLRRRRRKLETMSSTDLPNLKLGALCCTVCNTVCSLIIKSIKSTQHSVQLGIGKLSVLLPCLVSKISKGKLVIESLYFPVIEFDDDDDDDDDDD